MYVLCEIEPFEARHAAEGLFAYGGEVKLGDVDLLKLQQTARRLGQYLEMSRWHIDQRTWAPRKQISRSKGKEFPALDLLQDIVAW